MKSVEELHAAKVERARNRRGEGSKLRQEIVDAASRLVEDEGAQSVSLRSVARAVGISAPSIYPHFADVDAIIDAVIDEAFDELSEAISAAIETQTDAVERLRAGCVAYLEFAGQRPKRYKVAFGQEEPETQGDGAARGNTFQLLVDSVQACIDAGRSTSTEPFVDSAAIWVAMHGFATLREDRCRFPWPDQAVMLDRIITGLAKLTPQ